MWKKRNNRDMMKWNQTRMKSICIKCPIPSCVKNSHAVKRIKDSVSKCKRQSIKHLKLGVVAATFLPVSLLEGPIKIEKGCSLCSSITNSYLLFTLNSLGIQTVGFVGGNRQGDQWLPSAQIIRAACQQSLIKLLPLINTYQLLGLQTTEPSTESGCPELDGVPLQSLLSATIGVTAVSVVH